MGFALCASLDASYSHISVEEFDLGETFGLKARVIALGDTPHSYYATEISCSTKLVARHIWLLYLPRDDWFATSWSGEFNQIEVVFESQACMCGNVGSVWYISKMWKCSPKQYAAVTALLLRDVMVPDEAEMFTSEMHDSCARSRCLQKGTTQKHLTEGTGVGPAKHPPKVKSEIFVTTLEC